MTPELEAEIDNMLNDAAAKAQASEAAINLEERAALAAESRMLFAQAQGMAAAASA